MRRTIDFMAIEIIRSETPYVMAVTSLLRLGANCQTNSSNGGRKSRCVRNKRLPKNKINSLQYKTNKFTIRQTEIFIKITK